MTSKIFKKALKKFRLRRAFACGGLSSTPLLYAFFSLRENTPRNFFLPTALH
jgi:UDP-N-acetylglucosamine:LPS N-acetylglucosamine transferase